MDISPEMLGIARARGLYRRLYEIDLTGPLDKVSGQYGAVLSAGTFTHGHLGPGPLRCLLEIAHPGGLFIIGINRAHYEKEGFREALDAMR
jgi:predicted TPR repeat methyltransferase